MNTVSEFPNYYRRLEGRFQLVNGQAGSLIHDHPAPVLQAPTSLDEYASQEPSLARQQLDNHFLQSLQKDANSILDLARSGLEQLSKLDNSKLDRNPQAGLVVVPEIPAPGGWFSKLVKVVDRKGPPEKLEAGDCQRSSGPASAGVFPQYARATMKFTTPTEFHQSKNRSEDYWVDGTQASVEIGENEQGVQQILYRGKEGQILLTPDLAHGTLTVEEDSSQFSRAYLLNHRYLLTTGRDSICD